jgi:hypothetical protein
MSPIELELWRLGHLEDVLGMIWPDHCRLTTSAVRAEAVAHAARHSFSSRSSSPNLIPRVGLRFAMFCGSPAPWLLFAPAGYVGARTAGTFSWGIKAGLVTGVIAALTIPGDYLLFHKWIPGGVVSVIITLTASAVVAMFFAAIGAALARRSDGRGMSRWVFRLGHLTVAWKSNAPVDSWSGSIRAPVIASTVKEHERSSATSDSYAMRNRTCHHAPSNSRRARVRYVPLSMP